MCETVDYDKMIILYFNVLYCRVDDIEDNSTLRRGVPVAHHIYGIPSTLNSANYIYFLGLQKLLDLGKPEAAQVNISSLTLPKKKFFWVHS